MYLPNGAIFLADREVLMTSNRLYTERTFAYVMPPERSIDIDSPWELKLVSLLMGSGTNVRHS
jgi:CMP-N-acetylneuraminic acid synthetase